MEPKPEQASVLLENISFQEWEESIDVEVFYGRQEEVTQLKQWIIEDSCRLVALLGMGGMGKTVLAVKLAEQLQQSFDLILWRSLRHAPPIHKLLASLIQVLSQGQATLSGTTIHEKISQLMVYLRTRRCLLILDHTQAVLCSGNSAGYYAPGCEGYGELFRRLGEERHISCVLLTSREKPKEIALLEGEKLPIRSFMLQGLSFSAGEKLLAVKGLVGQEEELRALIKRYVGNPVALKMVATTIQDVFEGEIRVFLAQAILVFGDLRDLLDQQFNRLSNLEQKMIYWLVIHHRFVPIQDLLEAVVPGISKQEQIEAFQSLRRRSLIEKTAAGFILPSVVRAYLSQKLVGQVCEEMTTKEAAQLVSQTLIYEPGVESEREKDVV